MQRTLFVCLLILAGTLSIWAICAQAAPSECAHYMAVACHGDGVEKIEFGGAMYAYAGVLDAEGTELDFQEVQCGESDPPLYDWTQPFPGWDDEPYWWDPNLYGTRDQPIQGGS